MQSSDIIELDHSIGYSGRVRNSIHLHPNGKNFLQVAGATTIVGDLSDPHNQFFLRGHDDQITCIASSNSGILFASGNFFILIKNSGQKGDNSDVIIWNINSKKALYKLSEHDYEVSCTDFSHDDKLLLSTGNQLDGKMFIWDTNNGYKVYF